MYKFRGLTEKQREIYRFYRENPGKTAYEAGAALRKNPLLIGNTLQRLEELGFIAIPVHNGMREYKKLIFLTENEDDIPEIALRGVLPPTRKVYRNLGKRDKRTKDTLRAIALSDSAYL